jgi:hypothetical protein
MAFSILEFDLVTQNQSKYNEKRGFKRITLFKTEGPVRSRV